MFDSMRAMIAFNRPCCFLPVDLMTRTHWLAKLEAALGLALLTDWRKVATVGEAEVSRKVDVSEVMPWYSRFGYE